MIEINIPHEFVPRWYQKPLFNCIKNGYRRGVAIWHRRAGKDKTLLNLLVKESQKRVGAYYYFFPSYSQGRKILWDGMDRDGFRFLDHIPPEIREATNNTEMKIKLINGSLIQVVGSDNIDSIVGTNPVGCVFSEYSLQDPRGWDFIRPILRENGGWAVFNYTPRGHNHGYDLYQIALLNDKWFAERLKVSDTNVLVDADIQEEREAGMDEDLIQQEYYCSFEAAVPGAYYAKQLSQAREEDRVSSVPWEDTALVNTAWDLGIGDNMAIWFFQIVGREIRLIDFYQNSGEGLRHYIEFLKTKPYMYGQHIAPHDIEIRELGTGKSRKEVAARMGINFEVAPRMTLDDGIEATRSIFSRCYFDAAKCTHGIDALASYRKDYDERNRVYRLHPVHDWASHPADAFRYLATGIHLAEITPEWRHADEYREHYLYEHDTANI